MKYFSKITVNVKDAFFEIFEYLKKNPTLAKFVLFALLYVFIRFGWQESIEFGYDPGRLSQMVVDIMDKNELIDTPRYILENISIGSVAWGPIFVYLMLPFFMISRDPLVVTNLLIAFQFIGVIAFYLCVELLYNKRIAFFAAVFTILFPWHVYFTRMIYNPSMLLWSVPVVMYVTLLVVKKGKQKLLFLLPALWLVMIQFHFVGLVILLLSLAYIIVHKKKVTWRYFRIGLLIGIIPLLPILAYDVNHNFEFTRGVISGNKNPAKPDNTQGEVVSIALDKTQKYMLLTDTDNHLGYASNEFFKNLPIVYKIFHPVYAFLFFASILFYLAMILWKPKADDVFVFLWLIAVTVFLIAFNLKTSKDMTITQRYFIPSFFAIGIMIGRMLDAGFERLFVLLGSFRGKRGRKQLKKIDVQKPLLLSAYIASGVFALCFGLFMISYHSLVINYDYPEGGWLGWLGPDSGPPYASSYKAISTVLVEVKKEGSNTAVLSDDFNFNRDFHINNYAEYIWKYVFKKSPSNEPALPFYFMILGPPQIKPFDKLGEMRRYGPWRLFRKIGAGQAGGTNAQTFLSAKVILSLNSGMCIQVENGDTADGTFLVQMDYRAEPPQLFYLVESGEQGFHSIIAAESGKFLTMDAGDRPYISVGNNGDGQKWKIEVEDEKYRISTKLDGRVISVLDKSRNNYARIVCVKPSTNDPSQYWKINNQ